MQRSQADTALRENIEALITGWDLKDPNPEAYTNVLDAIARAAPIFQSRDGEGAAALGRAAPPGDVAGDGRLGTDRREGRRATP